MLRTIRSRIALAVAALGLAIVSLAPATSFAAADPTQGNAAPEPDVVVQIREVRQKGQDLEVSYTVQNVGTTDAGPAAVKIDCSFHERGIVANWWHSTTLHQPLGLDQSFEETITCEDAQGAMVSAYIRGETNTSNNVDEYNWWHITTKS